MATDLSPVEVQQFASQRRQATLEHQSAQRRYNTSKGQSSEKYGLGKAQSGERYGVAKAQSAEQYGLTKEQLALARAAMYSQQRVQREGLPGEYAGRGLLNSGIYQTGLNRYYEGARQEQERQSLGEREAEMGYRHENQNLDMGYRHENQNLDMGYKHENQDLDLAKQDADIAYYTAMVDLQEQENARRAELANELRGVM
jgi:hypothetical protein